MSDGDILDPNQFGRALAERAMTRMKDEGISRAEVAVIYAQELTGLADKMVRSGMGKHAVADWLETVTAAYRSRMLEE